MDQIKVKRYSRKREAILDKIRSTTSHPSAEWVYHSLRDEFSDLSLGTIYKNLALFKQEGQVISIGTIAGQERFDGNVSPHGHFICNICLNIFDVDLLDNEPLYMLYLDKMQIDTVSRVDLTAYGTCTTCSQAKG
jgi:Fur family peroxide stress response transcriptional regulator